MENITSWVTGSLYTECFTYVYFPFIIAGIIWLWRMDGSIPKPKKRIRNNVG